MHARNGGFPCGAIVRRKTLVSIQIALLALLLLHVAPGRTEEPVLSQGQTLYLPVYSHVWHGNRVIDGRHPMKNLMSVLVSVRNTSLKTPIRLLFARYYNTDGKLLKDYVRTPQTIAPLGTFELFVEQRESEGGSGANFILQWDASRPTNPPVVEAVHVDIQGNRTLSFTTTARAILADE